MLMVYSSSGDDRPGRYWFAVVPLLVAAGTEQFGAAAIGPGPSAATAFLHSRPDANPTDRDA